MTLTDLHCHILPGIDDGAASPDESIKMLAREFRGGVRRIALTSHFDCEKENVRAFLDKRQKAFEDLKEELGAYPDLKSELELKPAAEVMYSPNLVFEELSELCIEGTSSILIELPVRRRPYNLAETLFGLQKRGFDPIIAHVERYGYLMSEPAAIHKMVNNGIFFQINAGVLLDKGRTAAFCMDLIDWELVQIVASDAHGAEERRPNLDQGVESIRKKLGEDCISRIVEYSNKLFAGEYPETPDPYCPKKVFGRWR